MRAIELYSGIGGFAQAAGKALDVLAAIDHNQLANQVYCANFPHRLIVKNLETIKQGLLAELQADLWWMSPPCQPYTIRGAQRDLDDPRSRSFIRVVEAMRRVQPSYIALENVPWFEGSNGHELLLRTLEEGGYTWQQLTLCPSEFGIPNIRKRFYLIAGRESLHPLSEPKPRPCLLSDLIHDDAATELDVSNELQERFGDNLHVVDANDPSATTACFTSAYTNSPVYAGSYLRQGGRLRKFSPAEILRILGFPSTFTLPETLSLRQQYKLVGNSLSLAPVRHILNALPLRLNGTGLS